MKITYSEYKHPQGQHYFKIAYKYKLVDSILKTHFKALMKLTTLNYRWETKEGLISEKDKDAFLALVEKIEKSNSKRCATSHKKSIEKKKQSKASVSACEHEDLGSLGYTHGSTVKCPHCGQIAEVW